MLYSFAQKETFERDLMSFTSLTVSSNFTVSIKQTNRYAVNYTVWNEQLKNENIQFIFSGDNLEIKYFGNIISELDIHFELEVEQLTHFTVKNGGEIKLESPFDANNSPLSINTQFGGKFYGEFQQTPWIKVSVNQGGNIQLKGDVKLVDFSIRMGGTIDASQLTAENVNASVTLGGTINCQANTLLDAKVNGGGTIRYTGDGQVMKEVKLGGSINRI